MTYIDNIASALLNMHIFEMAHQRKDITNRLHALNMQIARHISKISLYPDHPARKHWENEVHTWCSDINEMKFDRNKKLKSEQYHEILYKKPFEHTDYVSTVAKNSVKNDDLPDYKWTVDHKQELENKIKNVYTDLSNQFGTDNYQHIKHTLKQHGI